MTDLEEIQYNEEKEIISLPTHADEGLVAEKEARIPHIHKQRSKTQQMHHARFKLNLSYKSQILDMPETEADETYNIHNKYREIWRRAYFKIRMSKCVERVFTEVVKYGTSSGLFDHNDRYRHNIEEILENKLTHEEAFRTAENEVKHEAPRYLIKPDSRFRRVWSYIIMILLLYTASFIPYRIAFEEIVYFDALTIVDCISDFIFMIDIGINLFTTYMLPDGKLETSQKQIFLRYLRGWFILDIVASIPFTLIDGVNIYTSRDDSNLAGGNYSNTVRLASFSRYKLLKVSRLFKIIKSYKKYDIFSRIADLLNINKRIEKLVSFVISVFVGIHLMGCFWYLVAKYEGLGPDTWVVRYGIQDESNSTLYISSIYWAMVTLSTIGYGDILPVTNAEKLIAIVWMILGVGFYSFTVGSLTSLLYTIDTSDASLNIKLLAIQEFAKEAGLDTELRLRLQKAVRYNSYSTEVPWSDKMALYEDLPQHLKHTISLNMHRKAAKHFTFFRNKSISSITLTVPLLKPAHVLSGEYIYHISQHADEVYFLSKGRANFIIENSGIVYKSFLKGSYFGECEIIQRIHREDTTQAYGNCEFLVLDSKQFRYLLEEYPDEADQIKAIAAEKSKRMKDSKEELIRLLTVKYKSGDLKTVCGMLRYGARKL